MSISTTLLTKMREKGITQYQLAEQAGYAQSYISQICAGKRTPTIGALTRIGECLDMPVKTFLEGDLEDCEPLTAQESRLLMLYQALDEPSRVILFSIAEQMYAAQGLRGRQTGRKPKDPKERDEEIK